MSNREVSSSLFSSRERPSSKLSDMNFKQPKKQTSQGSGCRSNNSGGGSVKQLVRSLSDRYASVTSPLTCKKRTSLNTTNSSKSSMSIKTMKTTAATSIVDHVHSKRVQENISINDPRLAQPGTKHFQPVLPSLEKKLGFVHGRGARSVNSSESSHNYRFMKDAEAESVSLTASRSSYGGFSSVVSCNTSPNNFIHTQLNLDPREPDLDKLLHQFENDQKNRSVTEWDQLDALFQIKHEELDSMRTAGLLLKDLCMRQSQELSLLKAAFPATLKEVARLRDEYLKQEKELAESRTLIPALQTQIRDLAEKIHVLTSDIIQLKNCKKHSPEPATIQVHEREASNSSGSTVSIEPLALNTSGYLESVNWGRNSRSSSSIAMSSHEKSLSSTTPFSPSRQDSASGYLDSISWGRKSRSNPIIAVQPNEKSLPSTTPSSPKKNYRTTSEAPLKNDFSSGKHRRGFSAVLSTEQLLKGTSKKSGRGISENDITDTLRELNNAADKEQNLLQERCVNVLKDLRSSSSRFANFEPLKSILICASPRFYRDGIENQVGSPLSFTDSQWNLKPT